MGVVVYIMQILSKFREMAELVVRQRNNCPIMHNREIKFLNHTFSVNSGISWVGRRGVSIVLDAAARDYQETDEGKDF